MKITLKLNNRPTKIGTYLYQRHPTSYPEIAHIKKERRQLVMSCGIGLYPVDRSEPNAYWSDALDIEYPYPLIQKLKIPIMSSPSGSYVPRGVLQETLKMAKILKRFHKLFGVQTCSVHGPYPWDVEAVLQRIYTGKLTGTQLFFD